MQNERQQEKQRVVEAAYSEYVKMDTDKGGIGSTDQPTLSVPANAAEVDVHFRLSIVGDRVVLDFGRPVYWIGADSDQALRLGRKLIKSGRKLLGQAVVKRAGDRVLRSEK